MKRTNPLGIRDQKAWFRTRYPGFRCTLEGGQFIAQGQLQPSPVAAVYDVIVEYRVGKWPKAFVPGDQLQPLELGGKIPHTYSPTEPCLFYPSAESWRSDMRLADTIVPWLSLWLEYYEMWRATGEWYGGGIPHGRGGDIEEPVRNNPGV
jgi:hypothetical protein